VAVSLSAGLAFESVYDLRFRDRPRDRIASSDAGPSRTASVPLPLRLVDSGGVGIPATDEWGKDYSHDLRAFRDVILEEPPYVDAIALEAVARQWHDYVERMRRYGNNGIVIPLLLELVDFSRIERPDHRRGLPVYASDSAFVARHAAVRRAFGPLFEWTERQGMQVFLGSDMLALTQPLLRYLREVAPGPGPLGVDASAPAVWDAYAAGLEELFDALPSIQGLVIRIGEAGRLYQTPGWPYRSEFGVRSAASLRAMLQGLLPVFEARGKTLVLRTWTVGVGPVGRLHVDPRVYEAVLGGFDSPALVVSTKFTSGDFFTYLPLNATLAGGRHRRLVELQARPEFEGFGAFPDFLGYEHARALRAFTAINPRIAGTYVWSQYGGPLRAGPQSLYSVHGFWLWTDANAFVASRLALEPAADANELLRQWATETFGNDDKLVSAVTSVLARTREAVKRGFYIRPFAEREVKVPGLDLPPLMWIFEWDMVGGWHSLLSLVYGASRDAVDVAIREGDSAAGMVRQARIELQEAFAAAGPDRCAPFCTSALRSLEYQETLFDTLAAWRQAFLSYYRWLERGDRADWDRWIAGRDRFVTAAARHVERFGGDADFPAFDLTSASSAIAVANRTVWVRSMAATLILVAIGLIAFARDRASAAVTLAGLTLVAFVCLALAGFTTARPALVALAVIVAFGAAFEIVANASTRRPFRFLTATVGPLIPALLLVATVLAYEGPLGFWYLFWMSPVFRVVLVTVILGTIFWTVFTAVIAPAPDYRWARFGGLLAGSGAGLVTLFILLPDWIGVLRFLNRPLNFAPATDTMLFALGTYAGVNIQPGSAPWLAGALLVLSGVVISRRARRGGRPLE
jgi:Glycosyl hydrolase family 67 C-terminus